MIGLRTGQILDNAFSSQQVERISQTASNMEDTEKARKAALEFEAYFVNILIKEMRKTLNEENHFIPKSQGEKIFEEMLDQKHAEKIAQTGSLGIANVLLDRLQSGHVEVGTDYTIIKDK